MLAKQAYLLILYYIKPGTVINAFIFSHGVDLFLLPAISNSRTVFPDYQQDVVRMLRKYIPLSGHPYSELLRTLNSKNYLHL
ncbi:MAG: hypothetical protein COW65_04260 [Cytophagales bacterium CG18_big_fil_WC_8_21_14_2_50_42_9]|nr:MAG: hypothetical protein COW65_04260 [Cytophagales bacterium CG18_big_fil_WC_8_21_14_2_50_42_9]